MLIPLITVDETTVDRLLSPVDVELDRLKNWLPFTASVESAAILPAATLVIRCAVPL